LIACLLFACGSDPPKPAKAPPRAEAQARAKAKPRKAKAKAKADRGPGIPRRCARKRGECLPPSRWVQRLCNDIYPDVALHMFSPGTPWKRLYMTARADAFNASNGASLIGEKLERGEEVIALKRRKNDGEFRVGDNAGYDVLRWNGACATIHDGDFSTEPPSEMRTSRIEWRLLGLDIRNALEAEPVIAETYEARRKSCRGRSVGRVSAECEEYDRKLVDEVVRYVQNGGKLPKPARLP
jgi:hypothetical protein